MKSWQAVGREAVAMAPAHPRTPNHVLHSKLCSRLLLTSCETLH